MTQATILLALDIPCDRFFSVRVLVHRVH